MDLKINGAWATVIILLVLGGVSYFFYTHFFAKNYCQKPISYSIDAFDYRFKISEDKFLENIQKSISLWETEIQRPLFVYEKTGGDLKINLIYDERQKSTEKTLKDKTFHGESTEFQQANYSHDGKFTKIDIYEFVDENSLIRVLTHELGHALGLEHVSGKDSILNEYNNSDVLSLSEEDKNELKNVCNKK